jgi:branched-chain amino acid transport system substrate-binding protein
MQWVFDTYNLSAGTARAVLRRGGDTWFLLVTDFAFGHDMAHAARSAIEAGGGRLLGSVNHPLATPDLSSFLLQAQASQAKIIGLAEGPPDTLNAIRQGLEFGVAAGGQTIVPFLAEITDIHALGLPTAQGIMLTTGFYWDMDDETRAWSRRYFDEVGAMPTMFQAGLYSAIRHYLKSVAAAGTTEGLAVAEKMRAMPVEDFFAKHGQVRPDGRMAYPLHLVQVKSPAESKYPWDYFKILETIPVADAYRPLSESDCPLVERAQR